MILVIGDKTLNISREDPHKSVKVEITDISGDHTESMQVSLQVSLDRTDALAASLALKEEALK